MNIHRYLVTETIVLPRADSPELDEWLDEDGNVDFIAYGLAKGFLVLAPEGPA